jgi:hypothetical protein
LKWRRLTEGVYCALFRKGYFPNPIDYEDFALAEIRPELEKNLKAYYLE